MGTCMDNESDLKNFDNLLKELKNNYQQWYDSWGETFEAIQKGFFVPEYEKFSQLSLPRQASVKDMLDLFPGQEKEDEESKSQVEKRLKIFMDIYEPLMSLKSGISVRPKKEISALDAQNDANQGGKWRLHMDPKHQRFGPNAYRKNGEASENEFEDDSSFSYMNNMFEVDAKLRTYLEEGFEIDLKFYKKLHDLAVANAAIEKIVLKGRKSFKSQKNLVASNTGFYGNVDLSMLHAALKENYELGVERLNMPLTPEELTQKNGDGEFYVSGFTGWHCLAFGSQNEIKSIEQNLTTWFEEYSAEIAKAEDDDEKYTAIVKLFQKLEKEHPYHDANGRVNRALLNALLVKNGFRETLLYDSGCAHFQTVENLITAIELGQKAYQSVLSEKASALSWQEVNGQLIEWEKENGIQLEFSLGFGQTLQSYWDGVNKITSKISDMQELHSLMLKTELPPLIYVYWEEILGSAEKQLDDHLTAIKNLCKENESYVETTEIKQKREKAITHSEKMLQTIRELKKLSEVGNGLSDSSVEIHPINENVGPDPEEAQKEQIKKDMLVRACLCSLFDMDMFFWKPGHGDDLKKERETIEELYDILKKVWAPKA